MKAYRWQYPVKLMARVLEVSRSGYYKWLTRGPSRRTIRDSMLKVLINCAHKRSRGTYGPLRLQDELAAENQRVGRDHISRLRKEMGLSCIQKKKFKITTEVRRVGACDCVGDGYNIYRNRRRVAVSCGSEGFRKS